MPFIAVPIDLPPDVVELRVGDADADGVQELVAISAKRRGTQPDAVSVSILNMDSHATVTDSWHLDLKDQALLIDIDHGLWALGPDGIMALEEEGLRTVFEARTPLSGLGQTAAVFADICEDMDSDGVVECVIARGRSVRVVDVAGRERAKVRVRSRGELEVRGRGGTQVVASAVSPVWRLDDFDGDGIQDLLLPHGKSLTVVTIDGVRPSASRDVPLPIDISPFRDEDKRKKNETQKRVISVWLEDMNGDNKTDFAAQIWVTKGSWLGSEGEVVFAPGTGSGFGPVQRLPSERAVLLVRLIDVDGDGDKDLSSAEMDFGVANLTRALLTQKIKVELMVRRMTSDGVGAAELLHSVVVPISNDREPPVDLEHDLTGDGIPDMVSAQGTAEVRLFQGTGDGYTKTPLASLDVGFKQGEDKIWAGDVTGDGRSDLIVWKPRVKSATVLLLTD